MGQVGRLCAILGPVLNGPEGDSRLPMHRFSTSSLRLLCVCGREEWWVGRPRWLYHVGPRLVRREVGHLVLSEPSIHVFALTHESWTEPVPTGVSRHLAGHAPWALSVGAVRRAMPACTHSTCVVLLRAVVGQVSPSMAFQAPCGFLLALLCVHMLLANDQTAGQYLVSSVQL